MEMSENFGDKVLFAAATGVAAALTAYVFWPSASGSKLRQRRGQIAGLYNFGKTCFLNSLLQALAACPQFIAWLQLNNHQSEKKSLISSLQNVLEVVNGTHPTLRGDPYSPGAVIRALNNLGWVIPSIQEHDPHELLHVMLSSLEEEAAKPKAPLGGLLDALQSAEQSMMPPPRPSSAMLSDFCNQDEYQDNFMRLVRSEVHTPDSPSQNSDDSAAGGDAFLDQCLSSSPPLPHIGRRINKRAVAVPALSSAAATALAIGNGALNKSVSNSYRSLERLNRGPGRVSVWSETLKMEVPHPFRGGLSSQLVCGKCNFKSVVRYDKFDSITLNLPETKNPALSLGHLLSEFIAPETLHDVKCDACEETGPHTKTLTFGKLPPCLCIHISRTTWLPSGHAYKRQDFVHFPETLSMAPYSFVQPGLNSNASTPWGSTLSLYSSSLPSTAGIGGGSGGFPMFPRNLYRLLAVVVHSGEANTGHFVTYRRGALRNAHKWYYTSDTKVEEVNIETVLSQSAYLLFYDRSTGIQSRMAPA